MEKSIKFFYMQTCDSAGSVECQDILKQNNKNKIILDKEMTAHVKDTN